MGTAFVEARVGENSFEGVWGGLRFDFGERDKTLSAVTARMTRLSGRRCSPS